MKSNVDISDDGWINITLIPETVAEAAALAHNAINATADARAVSSTYAHAARRFGNYAASPQDATMCTYVTLRTKIRDRQKNKVK